MGADKAEHYAIPECYMYPLYFPTDELTKKHIRLAASRWAKWNHRYPEWVRKAAYARIDEAKRKYKIGEYHVRQKKVVSLSSRRRKAAKLKKAA